MATSGAQISIRCDAHELMGMVPEGRANRLALCSFQAEMPGQVKTAQKPVVLMVAPEQRVNEEDGVPLLEALKLHKQ